MHILALIGRPICICMAASDKHPQERSREMAKAVAARGGRPTPPGAGSIPLTSDSQAARRDNEARKRYPYTTADRQSGSMTSFTNRRVLGVWSRHCACEQGVMTVKHILLVCPRWRDIR